MGNREYEDQDEDEDENTFLSAGASLVPSPVTATTSLPADMFESMIPFTCGPGL